MISSGSCESTGMRMLRSKEECEDAAKVLELMATTAHVIQIAERPTGCIYASNNWLSWASPHNHPNPNTPCGAADRYPYSCICSTSKYRNF